MEKYRILSMLFFVAHFALVGLPAQAEDTKVTAVYDDNAFRTGLTLPFVVNTVLVNSGAKIEKLAVEGATSAETSVAAACKITKDPYLPANFLLNCPQPGNVRIAIQVYSGSGSYAFKYGPIEVKVLKSGYTVPIDPKDPVTDPDIAAGRAIIFTNGCTTCHSQPKTSDLISKAIANKNILTSLAGKGGMTVNLSSDQATKVYKYLKTISDTEVWP